MLSELLRTTPASSPDYPRIQHRLADAWADLALAFALEDNRADAQLARRKAMTQLESLRSQFPHYQRLDEVLFALATEHDRAGETNSARKAYFEIVRQFPQSRLIPDVYLAFGESFFIEAGVDPTKLELAKAAYREVLKYPPPDNRVWAFAHYKLGWIALNDNDGPEALSHFLKVIEHGTRYASIPGASKLASEARKDIVRAYAQSGRPAAAWSYFRRLGDDAAAREMVGRLGRTYAELGKGNEAVALYKSVLDNSADAAWCDLIRRDLPEMSRLLERDSVARIEAVWSSACGRR